ncbi:hypothetical protein [Hoeflea sp.]|uniref:hypothetical protein n=1 Tax=Hoeflea sp. TaxID=1940281 RepID=UPI003A919758
MPEGYSKYHRHPGKPARTLQDAANDQQIIIVRCDHCRRLVNYLATDLVQVLNPSRPVYAPPFACSKCGTANYMIVHVKTPSLADHGHLVIRRLLGVKSVWEWGNRALGDQLERDKDLKRK